MDDNIKESKQFKNLGIDKDSVASVDCSARIAQPKKDVEQSDNYMEIPQSRPTSDTEALKQQIFSVTDKQIKGLAEQFSQWAKQVEERIARIEDQVQNIHRRENQRDLGKSSQAAQDDTAPSLAAEQSTQRFLEEEAAEQQAAERGAVEVKMTKPAPERKDDFSSDDVSVEKMFDYSNTKGQSKPRPNR